MRSVTIEKTATLVTSLNRSELAPTSLKPCKICQDLVAPARILDRIIPKCFYRSALSEQVHQAGAINQYQSGHQRPHALDDAPAVRDADDHEANGEFE